MLISNNINHYNVYNRNNLASEKKISAFGLQTDTVSFTAKPYSVEIKMKQISGLHDPYSDIIMVSDDEYDKYMKKVEKRPTALSMVNLLHGYEENLFTPEKEVAEILADGLKEYNKIDPKKANSIDLHDLLNEYYLGARVSLAHKQLNVLREIKEIVDESNGDTKEKLSTIFEPVRETIEDDSFRIGPLLSQVRGTKGIDRKVKKMVLKKMDDFPNSRNSAEVFIVTNANKTHEKIAEAFITPSRVSIEHIKPQSLGGPSNVSNYLVASKRMNSTRSSMSLETFIKRNPNIPHCIDRYFNDLVKKINQDGLTYLAASLPDVSNTLADESKGLIDIEIEGVSQVERNKVKTLKAQLNELIQKFAK